MLQEPIMKPFLATLTTLMLVFSASHAGDYSTKRGNATLTITTATIIRQTKQSMITPRMITSKEDMEPQRSPRSLRR